MTIEDAYEKLGLDKTASQHAIKVKYRSLSKMCHPDMNTDMDPVLKTAMDEEFILLQKAYEQLSRLSVPNTEKTPSRPTQKEDKKETNFVKVAQTNYKRGIFAYKKGDYNLALQLFQSAQRLDPNNQDYDRGVIRCLLTKTRRTHEAKELCMELVRKESYNPENYYLLGKIYEQANIPNQAIHFYNKAKSHGYNTSLIKSAIKEIEINSNHNKGFMSKFFKLK